MLTGNGTISSVFAQPVGILDANAPDGVREEQQLSLTLKSSSDDRDYQYSIPVRDDTVALAQLEQWMEEGQLVTVFASSCRAIPVLHDTSKDEQGNPIKRYQRAGRKVSVGQQQVEADAFIVFQAYDVRLAAQADLAKEAQRAHGEYLKQQREYKRRSVEKRVLQAKERIEAMRAEQHNRKTERKAVAAKAS